MTEMSEYASYPLVVRLPEDVLKAEFAPLDCGHCGDRLRMRLYGDRRLRIERAIACLGAVLLLGFAVAGVVWLFQDHLLNPDPFRTRAELIAPVLSALAPGAAAAVAIRRLFTVTGVALREPRAWATNQGHRHTVEEVRP